MYLRIVLAIVVLAAAAAPVRAQTSASAEPQAEDPRGRELDDLLAKGMRALEPLSGRKRSAPSNWPWCWGVRTGWIRW